MLLLLLLFLLLLLASEKNTTKPWTLCAVVKTFGNLGITLRVTNTPGAPLAFVMVLLIGSLELPLGDSIQLQAVPQGPVVGSKNAGLCAAFGVSTVSSRPGDQTMHECGSFNFPIHPAPLQLSPPPPFITLGVCA